MGCLETKTIENKNEIVRKRTQDQRNAHTAEVFLISCMDFRLLDDIVRAMDNLGYNNNYDQFIIAGSSLGLCQDKFPHWGQTCLDHMNIGLGLHDFRKIMVIDHIDCGAFKKFHPELVGNLDKEREYHKEYMQKLYDILIGYFPNIEFQSYLMDLEGDVSEIFVDKNRNRKNSKNEDNNTKFLSDMKNTNK